MIDQTLLAKTSRNVINISPLCTDLLSVILFFHSFFHTSVIELVWLN